MWTRKRFETTFHWFRASQTYGPKDQPQKTQNEILLCPTGFPRLPGLHCWFGPDECLISTESLVAFRCFRHKTGWTRQLSSIRFVIYPALAPCNSYYVFMRFRLQLFAKPLFLNHIQVILGIFARMVYYAVALVLGSPRSRQLPSFLVDERLAWKVLHWNVKGDQL